MIKMKYAFPGSKVRVVKPILVRSKNEIKLGDIGEITAIDKSKRLIGVRFLKVGLWAHPECIEKVVIAPDEKGFDTLKEIEAYHQSLWRERKLKGTPPPLVVSSAIYNYCLSKGYPAHRMVKAEDVIN